MAIEKDFETVMGMLNGTGPFQEARTALSRIRDDNERQHKERDEAMKLAEAAKAERAEWQAKAERLDKELDRRHWGLGWD